MPDPVKPIQKNDTSSAVAPPPNDTPPVAPPAVGLDFDVVLTQCCASAPYLVTAFELVRALGHALNPDVSPPPATKATKATA